MRRIAVLLTLAALGTVVPAQAASPPTGAYDCVIGSSSILFGTLKIKPGKKYGHRGTKGTFTTKGKRITFHKGDLNKMTGRFLKTTSGTWEIALRNPKDDFESIYCDQNK